MNQKEFDEGYNAFIEALKKSKNSNGSSDGGRGSGNGVGTVSTGDCSPIGNTHGGTDVGGMVSKDNGDKISTAEGLPVEGGTEKGIEEQWKKAAEDAMSKFPGNTPGGLKSRLGKIWKTSTNWRGILRKVVGSMISNDAEYKEIYARKKQLAVFGDLKKREIPDDDSVAYIMVFIDSSGSMTDEQLRMCLSEVYGVALAKKPMKLVVVQCDTEIEDIKEYTTLAAMKKDFSKAVVHGRGGTDLRPCWELLRTDKKYKNAMVELVMVFTDGGLGTWEGMKRDKKHMENVVWCFVDDPGFILPDGIKDNHTKVVYLMSKDIK